MNTYDIGIIGCGVAGSFAAYKIAKDHPNAKCILFEAGKQPGKRRFQMQGFLGLLPNSDGKLYLNELHAIKKLCKTKPANDAFEWFSSNIKHTMNTCIIQDAHPYKTTIKKIQSSGFSISYQDHIQVIPKEIHALSKIIAETLNGGNVTQNFDEEIADIQYKNKQFVITSYSGIESICKRIILATGRSGWRATNKLFNDFGLTSKDNMVRFGIRAELPSASIKEYNRSNCIISNEDIEIGPLSFGGTVVPEDHYDTVISSFRSNESRWSSDKVSFNIFGKHNVQDSVAYLDRIGQLTFILTNERVIKEKISTLLTKRAKISILEEYDWLIDACLSIEAFIPEISNGSFYSPALLPIVPKVKLTSKLQTEHKDLILAGETTGYSGLLFAILSGIIAGDSAAS